MFEVPAVHHHDFEIYGSEARLHSFFRALEVADIRGGRERYVEARGDEFVGLFTHGVYDARGALKSDMFAVFQEAAGPRTYPRRLLAYDKETTRFARLEAEAADPTEASESEPRGDEPRGDEPRGNEPQDDEPREDEPREDEPREGDPRDDEPQSSSRGDAGDEARDCSEAGDAESDYDDLLRRVSLHPRQFGRELVAAHAGAAVLPRSARRPRVRVDSAATQRVVQHALDTETVSPAARAVLLRSSFRVPYDLEYDLHDDAFSAMHMRRRSLHVLTTLLYLCMERRDYARAWAALTCLLRAPRVDVRLLWMPALELLSWRHDLVPTSRSPDDLLSWLIATNPHVPKARHNVHRYLPRATDLLPVSILIKLVGDDARAAREEADQAVKSLQHASDPACWALAGLARLVVQGMDARVQTDFVKCLDLGGALPTRLRRLAAENADEEVAERLLDGLPESDAESDMESEAKDDSQSENESKAESNKSESDGAESDAAESDAEPGAPPAKRPKLEASSQHFFSQSASLGAELGSSDSDDFF